jgi:hypothetical protein
MAVYLFLCFMKDFVVMFTFLIPDPWTLLNPYLFPMKQIIFSCFLYYV